MFRLTEWQQSHPLLQKYAADADATFVENRARFSEEAFKEKLDAADLKPQNRAELEAFMRFAREDEELLRALWLFYYFQFNTDECFLFSLWGDGLDSVKAPAVCEERFPGYFRSAIYLASVDHLIDHLKKHDLPMDYVNKYYDKYKVFAEENMESHHTYGFCRLAPFMYVYAYPAIARIGRLVYQIHRPEDWLEIYQSDGGDLRLIALPTCTYNREGHRDENGDLLPVYQKEGDTLLAHRFDDEGHLCLTPERLDLTVYHPLLSEGEYVAYIHIPADGKLTHEAVDASLKEAKETLPRLFPSFPVRHFACSTWLLDTHLAEVLPEGSNILDFGRRFVRALGPDNKNVSLRSHIFRVPLDVPLEALVPQNSFQQKMLDRAKAGKAMYWTFGILPESLPRT